MLRIMLKLADVTTTVWSHATLQPNYIRLDAYRQFASPNLIMCFMLLWPNGKHEQCKILDLKSIIRIQDVLKRIRHENFVLFIFF